MDDLQEILQYDPSPSLCNGVKHDMVEDKSSPILTNGGCDTEATPTPYLETKASPQTLETTSTPNSEPVKMETTSSQLFETTPIQPTTISKQYPYQYISLNSH